MNGPESDVDVVEVSFPLEPGESVVAAPVPELRDYTDRTEMWLVIRALRKKNPIRQAAERVMEDPSERRLAFEDLMRILQRPNGYRWKERTLAAWMLGMTHLSEAEKQEAADSLLKVYKREEANDLRGAAQRCLLRSTVVGLVVGLVVVCSQYDSGIPVQIGAGLFGFALGTLAGIPFVYPFSKAMEADILNQVRAASARALGRLESAESIGPLAETIASRVAAPRLKRAAESALPEAARALRPEHYGELGPEITPNLCRVAHHRSQGLAAHALAALAKVGDGRALEDVRRIAKRGPSRLRPWAERALPILEERHRRENAPKTLLRAAEASPDEGLLRPSGAAGHEDPDRLLRPAEDWEPV